ncbi:MAG: hypothetical protein ACYDGR_07805 [Candidatus Dormibacteria bacterium]
MLLPEDTGLQRNCTDLIHLSPTLHEHINPYGKYRFDVDAGLSRSGLRPLRHPDEWSMP